MKPSGNTHDRKWLKPLAGVLAGVAVAAVAFAPSANAAPVNAVAKEEGAKEFNLTPEEEAVWTKFDKCLAAEGIDVDKLFADGDHSEDDDAFELGDVTDPKLKAALEKCDKILDSLPADSGADVDFEDDAKEDVKPSASDQAVFDKFDKCLTDAGVNVDNLFDLENDMSDAEAARLDKAFDKCESILDELSSDGLELTAEEQAEYDKFSKCLAAEGITEAVLESEGDDTPEVTARIDAAFEKCQPGCDN